ncbi:hypothetical protein, conserved [Trypanosoma brucei brucei TREU927]|uniref:tRNA (adenine(58)-N(1))-methyltransferase n=1 Tax=Trypanosoma brucei brucei (strain 927/4 GUTat10.1) TaxID=185431 RepID=Q383B4_TRYB2|nr:hypothetical protein, conserved [Trypanosoma brucei brucei TREU927]EAN80117.1 hypothetical protein, conserved [Trypanosoma brucei brucei TREU927]
MEKKRGQSKPFFLSSSSLSRSCITPTAKYHSSWHPVPPFLLTILLCHYTKPGSQHMLAPRGSVAKEGDVVLLFRGHLQFTPLLLQRGAMLHCKDGKFMHDDIIGCPLGTRVMGRSNLKNDPRGAPSVLVMQNCADLWTVAVPHRTQIIYDTDIAVIVFNLRLRPGHRVAEAGTGSGSLTHSLARTVAPDGIVYTYDFHKKRCLEALQEFRRNGLPASLVRCNWRDVCVTASGSDESVMTGMQLPDAAQSENKGEDKEEPEPGYGLPKHHVDAVFLDVPSPWLAIDNVLHVLRPGGMLCTFSPCIEQTQRTAQRLRQAPQEFIDIRTVEVVRKFINPVCRKRNHSEGTEGESNNKPTCRFKFRPALVSMGHTAYLTFARRRLERIPVVDTVEASAAATNTASSSQDVTAGGGVNTGTI